MAAARSGPPSERRAVLRTNGRAQTGADPELAAASARLAEQLTPQWTKFDASPTIKAAMQRYATLDEVGRYRTVEDIFNTPAAGLGAPAGSRGSSPRRSFLGSPRRRSSANSKSNPTSRRQPFPLPTFAPNSRNFDQAFGPSDRDPARWLGALAADESPAKELELWRQLLATEQQLAQSQPAATNPVVMWTLAWQTLRTALANDDPAAALETWDTITKVADDDPRVSYSSVQKLLTTIADAKAWRVGDAVLAERATLFDTKLRKYLAAEFRRRQGSEVGATQLAEEAARFVTPEGLEPFAQQLDERNLVAMTLQDAAKRIGPKPSSPPWSRRLSRSRTAAPSAGGTSPTTYMILSVTTKRPRYSWNCIPRSTPTPAPAAATYNSSSSTRNRRYLNNFPSRT